MHLKKVKFLVGRQISNEKNLSGSKAAEMSLSNLEATRLYLKNLLTRKGIMLEIDLAGIHSINNEWIDTFNYLSRIARKYDSSIRLVGVEAEVLEMIDLIRQYYFFDIKHILPAC